MDLGAHQALSFSTGPSLRAVSTQTLSSEVQGFISELENFFDSAVEKENTWKKHFSHATG